MKILFLTSRLPYPPYRGDKLKIYNLIKRLSKRHEVTLVSFIASRDELQFVPPLREHCARVETVYLPAWRSVANCVRAIAASVPFQVAYYRSREMQSAFSSIVDGAVFDVIHVHLIRMAPYALTGRPTPPRVFDLTDAGSLYLERFRSRAGNPFVRFLVSEELRRLSRYEKVLEDADLSLVCSEIDRKVLAARAPKATLKLLYNGIDLEYFSVDGAGQNPDENRIIFTGNLTYFPNRDGIRYFMDEIYPRIRARVPGVKLYIVGKDPPPAVRRYAGDGVVVTGFVDDIKTCYLQSTVAVSPIRFGAGTLNKVLEPLALGIPVVTSSVGVEGLPLRDGEDLLIADEPAAFADAVIRVLGDPSLRRRLSGNSGATVRRLYDWDVIVTQLESYYQGLVDAK